MERSTSRLLSLIPAILLFLVAACDRETECPPRFCTEQFVSVALSFADASGNPVPVRDVAAVNTRTGTNYAPEAAGIRPDSASRYIIITDSEKQTVSGRGDTIRVTAAHAATGQEKTAELVVSGGECACHIQKVSGPARVVFDQVSGR